MTSRHRERALIGDFYAPQGVRFTTPWYATQLSEDTFPRKSGLIHTFGFPTPSEIEFTTPVSNALKFSAYGDSGFLGSVSIPTTAQPTPGGPQYYELSFSGIVRVTFEKSSQKFFSLDDLTFTPAIPEPASRLLLCVGAGFILITFGTRKKRC
jgi:hypothetical protein